MEVICPATEYSRTLKYDSNEKHILLEKKMFGKAVSSLIIMLVICEKYIKQSSCSFYLYYSNEH